MEEDSKAQRTLDQDLKEIEVPERIVPYSDRVFRQVAVEWLAATDQVSNSIKSRLSFSLVSSQPIQALEHAKFRELVNIASRATKGINIPGRKATRGVIKRMFSDHIIRLKAQLNVS